MGHSLSKSVIAAGWLLLLIAAFAAPVLGFTPDPCAGVVGTFGLDDQIVCTSQCSTTFLTCCGDQNIGLGPQTVAPGTLCSYTSTAYISPSATPTVSPASQIVLASTCVPRTGNNGNTGNTNTGSTGATATVCTYTVVSGDSLGAIATKYGTTVAAIQGANPAITNVNNINVGQVINVPFKTSGTCPVVASGATASPTVPPAGGVAGIHTPADCKTANTFLCAKQCGKVLIQCTGAGTGVLLDALDEALAVCNNGAIDFGTNCVLAAGEDPAGTISTTSTVTVAPTTAATTTKAAIATTVNPGTFTCTYTVVAGDTLGAIAKRFGTTVTALSQANNLQNPNLLAIGQTLKYPPPCQTTTPTAPPTTATTAAPSTSTFAPGGVDNNGNAFVVGQFVPTHACDTFPSTTCPGTCCPFFINCQTGQKGVGVLQQTGAGQVCNVLNGDPKVQDCSPLACTISITGFGTATGQVGVFQPNTAGTNPFNVQSHAVGWHLSEDVHVEHFRFNTLSSATTSCSTVSTGEILCPQTQYGSYIYCDGSTNGIAYSVPAGFICKVLDTNTNRGQLVDTLNVAYSNATGQVAVGSTCTYNAQPLGTFPLGNGLAAFILNVALTDMNNAAITSVSVQLQSGVTVLSTYSNSGATVSAYNFQVPGTSQYTSYGAGVTVVDLAAPSITSSQSPIGFIAEGQYIGVSSVILNGVVCSPSVVLDPNTPAAGCPGQPTLNALPIGSNGKPYFQSNCGAVAKSTCGDSNNINTAVQTAIAITTGTTSSAFTYSLSVSVPVIIGGVLAALVALF